MPSQGVSVTHRGYWMINDRNNKQPVYFSHVKFLAKANAWVDDFRRRNGRPPRQEEYNAEAAGWIE